jgi:hypothetical protein
VTGAPSRFAPAPDGSTGAVAWWGATDGSGALRVVGTVPLHVEELGAALVRACGDRPLAPLAAVRGPSAAEEQPELAPTPTLVVTRHDPRDAEVVASVLGTVADAVDLWLLRGAGPAVDVDALLRHAEVAGLAPVRVRRVATDRLDGVRVRLERAAAHEPDPVARADALERLGSATRALADGSRHRRPRLAVVPATAAWAIGAAHTSMVEPSWAHDAERRRRAAASLVVLPEDGPPAGLEAAVAATVEDGAAVIAVDPDHDEPPRAPATMLADPPRDADAAQRWRTAVDATAPTRVWRDLAAGAGATARAAAGPPGGAHTRGEVAAATDLPAAAAAPWLTTEPSVAHVELHDHLDVPGLLDRIDGTATLVLLEEPGLLAGSDHLDDLRRYHELTDAGLVVRPRALTTDATRRRVHRWTVACAGGPGWDPRPVAGLIARLDLVALAAELRAGAAGDPAARASRLGVWDAEVAGRPRGAALLELLAATVTAAGDRVWSCHGVGVVADERRGRPAGGPLEELPGPPDERVGLPTVPR